MSDQTLSEWTPPKIWKNTESGGRFANINRPTAGAREEKALPIGKHPFQLYSLGTPNGVKVTIMFEELLEACLLYTSPSPRDRTRSRMPSSA